MSLRNLFRRKKRPERVNRNKQQADATARLAAPIEFAGSEGSGAQVDEELDAKIERFLELQELVESLNQ